MNLSRYLIRMVLAEADAAAAGGGGDAKPEAEKAPPPGKTVEQLQAELASRDEREAGLTKRLQQAEAVALAALSRPQEPGERAPPPQEESAFADPEVDKKVASAVAGVKRELLQHIGTVADQADAARATEFVRESEVDEKTQQDAAALFDTWRRRGVNATRIDALTYVLGNKALTDKKAQKSAAEAARKAELAGTGVDRPGGTRRVAPPVDLEKLPPGKQVEALEKTLEGVEF